MNEQQSDMPTWKYRTIPYERRWCGHGSRSPGSGCPQHARDPGTQDYLGLWGQSPAAALAAEAGQPPPRGVQLVVPCGRGLEPLRLDIAAAVPPRRALVSRPAVERSSVSDDMSRSPRHHSPVACSHNVNSS